MAGSAATRYAALEADRRPYMDRGRECAKVTIPSVFPDEGTNGSTKFAPPEQSFAARGVNTVASKMLMALFPPNAPYFKMEVDALTANELTQQEGLKDEVDRALAQFVRRVMTDFEGRALRADLYEIFRLLIITGNATLFVTPEGRCRVYRLDKYVCLRDPSGVILEWASKEAVAKAGLPEELRNKLQTNTQTTGDGGAYQAATETVDLYTHVVLTPEGTYLVYQEVEGEVIDGTEGEYLANELPFLVLRYNKADGESYGRGLIEELYGDIAHLESLSQSIREFVAISARVLPIVDPNGFITAKDLVEAENGEPLVGNASDISFLQIERYNDFRVAKEMINEVTQRLTYAFLMNSAVQRPGERVTAEEIRYVAREVEDILGGTYTVQAVDLQNPLATLQIKSLERAGSLPELPTNVATPKVVTGMDALGRGNDLSNLMQFLSMIGETPAAQNIKWDQVAIRVANGLNIETDGLMLTPEEIQAQQQQQMMMQMMSELGPNAVNQVGGIAKQQMEQPTDG